MLLGTTLLAGCDPAPSVTYCPTPVHPDAVTRAWLHTLTPPQPAVHYFNQLANQQALFDRGCR